MVSVNLQNNYNVYQTNSVRNNTTVPISVSQQPIQRQSTQAFRAQAYSSTLNTRTELTTKEEKKKYNELVKELDKKSRKKLEFALKSGILLKNNSDSIASLFVF